MIDTTFLAVGALMLLSGYAVMGRGNLVRMQHQVTEAWKLIKTPLKQRDVALSALETLCRASVQEPAPLERVAAARAQVARAHEAFDPVAFAAAETELRNAISGLCAAAKKPGLDTDSLLQPPLLQLSACETGIADRCRVYNAAVDFINVRIGQFPYLLLARPLGFHAFDRLDPTAWKATDTGGKVSG
ncbi:MAG: LemA family protein [Porticoccaceae bacterium]